MRLLSPLLLIAGAWSSALASQGDRSPAFQRCVSTCVQACPSLPLPSWSLWPCSAECAYACTTALTDFALLFPRRLPTSPLTPEEAFDAERLLGPGGELEGLDLGRQVQFFGKWPFRRLFGTQELLAVAFSLANLWAHAKGWRDLGRMDVTSVEATTLRRLYQANALVGINTWVWSVVFHTRDTAWTEKADYFSAAASTLFGLWLAGVRAGGLYKDQRGKRRWRTLTQLAFSVVFIAHCTYLSGGRFDYSYNMAFNVAFGLAQILLWSLWGLTNFLAHPPVSPLSPSPSNPPPRRSKHYLKPLVPVWLLFACTALELFDFEPVPSNWRLLDAHALWHASTVGVVRIWYRFLEHDVWWVEGAIRGEQGMGGAGGVAAKRRVQ